MNKTVLATAMGLALGGAVLTAQAALTSSSVLVYTPGNTGNFGGAPTPAGASWFSMEVSPGFNIYTGINCNVATPCGTASDKGYGIAMHETFDNTGNPMGSHSGAPNGSEAPRFDLWGFFGNTGMDYLTAPMADLGPDPLDPFTHYIDMSGWTVTWNAISKIPMGGDTANFPVDTGIGTMTCSTTSCSASSTFTLDHLAHVPLGDPSNFGGVQYGLHLTGVIGTSLAHVPVPAAAWLFGSGLMGLAAVARRRKAKA